MAHSYESNWWDPVDRGKSNLILQRKQVSYLPLNDESLTFPYKTGIQKQVAPLLETNETFAQFPPLPFNPFPDTYPKGSVIDRLLIGEEIPMPLTPIKTIPVVKSLATSKPTEAANFLQKNNFFLLSS